MNTNGTFNPQGKGNSLLKAILKMVVNVLNVAFPIFPNNIKNTPSLVKITIVDRKGFKRHSS
jgi:hypothetical protein